jgi:hypothetical protein
MAFIGATSAIKALELRWLAGSSSALHPASNGRREELPRARPFSLEPSGFPGASARARACAQKFRILRKFRRVVCSVKRNASLSSSPRQRRAYGHSTSGPSRCTSTTERGGVLHPRATSSPGPVVVISCFYAPVKSPICFNKLEHELK